MLQKHLSSKYNKALVLGTGGGNDIVSDLIVALDLQKQGIKTVVDFLFQKTEREGQKEK